LMHLFGQRGIPASLRNINGFSVHTYTLNKAVSIASSRWNEANVSRMVVMFM
jgi:catalase